MKELDIINHYGINHQQRKLQEEVSELIEAIIQYEMAKKLNLPLDKYRKHVVEEHTDVTLLMNQIRDYYKIDYDESLKVYEYKFNRTIEGMNK